MALPRRSEPPPDSSDPIPSRQPPAQADPVVPDDSNAGRNRRLITTSSAQRASVARSMVRKWCSSRWRIPVWRQKTRWYLPPFWMDKTPVTNAEYNASSTQNPTQSSTGMVADIPKQQGFIQSCRSLARCCGVCRVGGQTVADRPSVEKAARGTDGRIYPGVMRGEWLLQHVGSRIRRHDAGRPVFTDWR